VGDVRVIAGILDRPGFGAALAQATELQAHLHLFALGQSDVHRVGSDAGEQQARGGEAGGGGAAAGGEAAAQGRGLFGGFVTHRGV